jgi:hypothetical protein
MIPRGTYFGRPIGGCRVRSRAFHPMPDLRRPVPAAPFAESAAMTGAQFEIRIDGTPRTFCDRKDYAMEAARLIKSKNPHSMVEVKDLQSGDVAAVALTPA